MCGYGSLILTLLPALSPPSADPRSSDSSGCEDDSFGELLHGERSCPRMFITTCCLVCAGFSFRTVEFYTCKNQSRNIQ